MPEGKDMGRVFASLPCPAPPWEEAQAFAHLMPCPLEWQASEDVAKILDHNSILLIPVREVGGWVLEPPERAAVGSMGTQQCLP